MSERIEDVIAEMRWFPNQPYDGEECCDWCKRVRGFGARITAALERDRMRDILVRTANALKGEPPPLHLHDWSDLPDVVQNKTAEIADMFEEIKRNVAKDRAAILKVAEGLVRDADRADSEPGEHHGLNGSRTLRDAAAELRRIAEGK